MKSYICLCFQSVAIQMYMKKRKVTNHVIFIYCLTKNEDSYFTKDEQNCLRHLPEGQTWAQLHAKVTNYIPITLIFKCNKLHHNYIANVINYPKACKSNVIKNKIMKMRINSKRIYLQPVHVYIYIYTGAFTFQPIKTFEQDLLRIFFLISNINLTFNHN